MRILELRFKNLNSLYGEWVIDFTDPEYVSNGIFALTGPTGAGKSTILDAICLALYGATPRLGKITKSRNEIMSRQTGECYAEVWFESQVGRFRCHWEQRRARKRADGKLQDQEHQIADADTGKPIETQKSRVAGVIEEKTGMDFERFTRSILLAQGNFDTFLKAAIEQKSKILEQITGTEIYSEISRRVHERQRDEREKLNLLQAEISGIAILMPEEEQAIRRDLEVKKKEETERSKKSTQTAEAIKWLAEIENLKQEINGLTGERTVLRARIEAFKPKRDELEWAIRAASQEGLYATLTAIQEQQSEDQAALKAGETALPELESSAEKQAELHHLAERQTVKAKEARTAAAPLIQAIRSLDQNRSEREKALSEATKSCTEEAAKIDAHKEARRKEQEKRDEAEERLEHTKAYLQDHAQDEWLTRGLSGLEAQLSHLRARQKDIFQKKAELKDSDTALKQAVKECDDNTRRWDRHKQELEEASKERRQWKAALSALLGDRLLREYRNEKESLLREQGYLEKIEQLEAERAKLEDGKPCPLCGAKAHPFAEGNIPIPDETEQKIESLTQRITRAEALEAYDKEREKAETAAQKNLTESEKRKAITTKDKETAEESLLGLKKDLAKRQADYKELKQAVLNKLQPLGITPSSETSIASLLKSLQDRLNAWQSQVDKKKAIERELVDIDAEIKHLDAIIETQHTGLAQAQAELKTLREEHTAGIEKRKELYGDKKPDVEESRLDKAIADAEEREKKFRSQNMALQQNLNTARTQIETLKKRIEQRDPELKKAKADFSSALEGAGFSDKAQFLDARLPAGVRDTLSTEAKELDKAQTALKATAKDRETRLAKELAKERTDKALDELEPQFQAQKEALRVLREAIAGLKHKLSENTAAQGRLGEKQTAIEAQKKECHRWEKLHELIGSADGKKYRNFAQGLTFEVMVSHANRQLKKMTDRYLLIRDDEQPLELNVVDAYQAGEIRSTKNLSGGERFIVSLTLALGLSKMASRKVRVDSLFLDEGFGTLDEEALETALETLSGLQQDGKLIGIISHVSALKERIRTQLSITPVSGGRSSLSGPGCSKCIKGEQTGTIAPS